MYASAAMGLCVDSTLRFDRRRLAAFQSPPEFLKSVRRLGFQAALHEPPRETAEHPAPSMSTSDRFTYAR